MAADTPRVDGSLGCLMALNEDVQRLLSMTRCEQEPPSVREGDGARAYTKSGTIRKWLVEHRDQMMVRRRKEDTSVGAAAVQMQQIMVNKWLCRHLAHEVAEAYDFWKHAKQKTYCPKEFPFDLFVRALRRADVLLKECCCDDDNLVRVAAAQVSGNKEFVSDIMRDLRTSCAWGDGISSNLRRYDINQHLASFEAADSRVLERKGSWDMKELLEVIYDSSMSPGRVTGQACLLEQLRHRISVLLGKGVINSESPVSLFMLPADLPMLEHLGHGAYGAVYKTKWLGAECAKKVLFHDSEYQESFKSEAAILNGLRHPNVVQLYGCSVERSKSCLVMELIASDLRNYIDSRRKNQGSHELARCWADTRPFAIEVALDIIFQIAKGLKYLHDKGIAHRDIKSTNILLSPSQDRRLAQKGFLEVKLADFGIAKAKALSSTFTKQTPNVGSTLWRAPELSKVPPNFYDEEAHSERNYPLKADIYSFGITCSEILTGELPFVHLVQRCQLHERIMEGERPSMPLFAESDSMYKFKGAPKLGDDLNDLVRECWDINPQIRPTAREIVQRLRKLISVIVLSRTF